MSSVSQSPDDLFIQKIVDGDEQALLALYDRYSSRVYGLALKMLGEPMLAEEITQDVFLKLWSRARNYLAERGSFPTWLLAITRNTALDRIRLENRRPPAASEEENESWIDQIDSRSDPEEARWRSLKFAVQSLPADQQQVIDLAYFYGLSHSEIAEHTGLPLGTVKTRLRAGMEQLRKEWFQDEKLPES